MATYSSQQMEQAYLDQSRQDLHVVKCVVVGDTGVGKTRLICAQASGTSYNIQQLMTTHVPTVWAIDHYRKDREILERSWVNVDSINVSLRLWDTFGYHDKDRRFAYGRADVILVCFSLVRPRSLRNVLVHWLPEVRRLSPGVPVVLCGCQADLRYLYNRQEFMSLDKGPFFREISECDMIAPEQGREAAQQLGAYYYETSVLHPSTITDTFKNVIRAALTYKRDKHFWNVLGGLKRMQRPLPQEPLCPPKPAMPQVQVSAGELEGDLRQLLESQAYCDVIFVARGVCIQAHRAYLTAASTVFQPLFMTDFSDQTCPHQNNPSVPNNNQTKPATNQTKPAKASSMSLCHKKAVLACLENTEKVVSKVGEKDTLGLLDNEEVETDSVCSSCTETAESSPPSTITQSCDCKSRLPKQALDHPAFCSLQLQQCEDVFNPGHITLRTVVTLNDNISATAFQHVLFFLYTGRVQDGLPPAQLKDIRRAAELIGLSELGYIVSNLLNDEDFLNTEKYVVFESQRCQRIRDLLIDRGLMSDVLFQVDDGSVAAHKALLMARCDVMAGMFSYNFRESSAKVIHFPGVTRDTFTALQDYLYTGYCPSLKDTNCLELIELANRMCLDRLLALTQQCVVKELTVADEWRDISEDVLALLESAQLHNAWQLTEWCLWYLCTNYRAVYKKHGKLINSLRPENQIHLAKFRWPPVWYLKEVDYYEKCLIDAERSAAKPALRSYIRRGSDDIDSGCLAFCSRKSRKTAHVTAADAKVPVM